MNKESFQKGFMKAASLNGVNPLAAVEMLKRATEWDDEAGNEYTNKPRRILHRYFKAHPLENKWETQWYNDTMKSQRAYERATKQYDSRNFISKAFHKKPKFEDFDYEPPVDEKGMADVHQYYIDQVLKNKKVNKNLRVINYNYPHTSSDEGVPFANTPEFMQAFNDPGAVLRTSIKQ